ncbi:glutamine amidotransferase subunit DUG3 [Ascoidea rubescens DSM 1968]|uniref:N-terminal nucleophile aminohydrolase n=1 Tax=Ascoidea rubescens DSM 1968 TaxID=1344418 RepID=A0A1D2VJ37_9ASCO|nr:N-terminal nucleophile aminohydrolase [Ascoidea rubescens DSM 1968]ODV61580.1 N-terminal nucleophile aminohydrolase [Ascoidea rubescens DSM 1968]
MCRFLIFKGTEPIKLSHLLTRPAHSIINQSFDSRLRLDRRRPINGDGFGVGYYSLDPDLYDQPCLFRAITPAWNNQNLETLAERTKSNLVFAHVRASTYGVLSETNCHPFVLNSLMFMHNGGISNFNKIKRRILAHLKDEYFLFIQGSTDSEVCFALFLDTLDKMGYDPHKIFGNFGHDVLRTCLLKTIEYINKWLKEISNDIDFNPEPSLLNFAVTDSSSVVISRYITSKTQEAASLHFSCGSAFVEYEPGQYKMERLDRRQDIIMVASEPLTFERGDWITVPTNTTLTIKGQTVLLHPIIDEYYQRDPLFERSSDFAESKGLMGSVPLSDNTNSEVPPLEREGRSRNIQTPVFTCG